jgi:beta-galactosidase/beta-glucuronidase
MMMKGCAGMRGRSLYAAAVALAMVAPAGWQGQAQQVISVPTLHLVEPSSPLQEYGPYNARILIGGRGLSKPLVAADSIFGAGSSWTMTAWLEVAPGTSGSVLIAGVGRPVDASYRMFALVDGRAALRLGEGSTVVAQGPGLAKGWHAWAATFDGVRVQLYLDGVLQGSQVQPASAVAPVMSLGPVVACAALPCPHFGGRIAGLTLAHGVASAAEIAARAAEKIDPELILFEEGSKPWPLQVVQYAGNLAPQEPWAMPQRKAPFSQPEAKPLPPAETTLVESAPADWVLRGGWKLAEAPLVKATAQEISSAGFDTSGWMAATVPGTVLTTMIDRGRYPEPDYGMNNLDIPERLSRESYWYRAEFARPATEGRSQVELVLEGINYHAEVWLNGQRLGEMTGAFERGRFEVGRLLRAQGNVLAIRVSPVPHPGIPNVQSIVLGSGLNGGAMELDGPTFEASEGWDWNPPMHDRDTGLWQDVHLEASGAVSIGDPQVVTKLPLPDISQADVTLRVPLENAGKQAVEGVLTASFEGVEVRRRVSVPAGGTIVELAPAEFAELHLKQPRLWWPNGYGKPELYHLTTTFAATGTAQVVRKLTFGVREVTYEISLLDNEGALRRVEYDPTVARTEAAAPMDVTHAGMREVPDGWASSIAAGEDASPAFHTLTDTRATPYLAIKVNGVRIAVRGGSWGMDDSRKRVSREHLEPFFRYDQEANVNTIRNWQGQNTEEVFYELADEYGMLVWNDFWEVTTDSNAEAEDPQLFLANARDTILRYRNHPSIVMWCGRNEGVPQPIINEGLIKLTHELDGTRYYSPSSNQVNLQPSGPYSYQDPAAYSSIDPGFAVEVGTPSLPTLEWFGRWLPEQDRWPIDDAWAYHNWHPHDEFNEHMQAQFGAAGSLKQYVQQAQMMNYVDYRAIFEGFNAHLWAPNTGRLLWMTQPSWPSMLWGILSSDYDTQASYYATKKACEPLHVQLDVASGEVQVVDTTREALRAVKVEADVYALNGQRLLHRESVLDAAADDVTPVLPLELTQLEGDGTVLVHLAMRSQAGELLSENLYWRAASDAGYRKLNEMAAAQVEVSARGVGGRRIEVRLKNAGTVAALNVKLVTEQKDGGAEVLPAFYSDNYVSLLPGQERVVTVDLPRVEAKTPLEMKVYGWNVGESVVAVAP